MRFARVPNRGFSLIELLMVMAVAGTIMVIALPVLTNVTEGAKLNGAAREIEREFQAARLRSVSTNSLLRVRMNCPAAGYFRTVEYVNQAAIDSSANRCVLSAYPFPAADQDRMTRPNHDGPLRMLPDGATVNSLVLQFHPDGTVTNVVSNVPQTIVTPLTVTVTRNSKSKAMTVNGAGKIQLQ
jgi:prepilin-type N-terminal cleavage/methylation domain-containing protein